jgi:hypothetical protein
VTTDEIVGFAAMATNVAGNILITRKSWHGWWVRIISILLWGAYGISDTRWPVIANAVVFFGINCYGIWAWRRSKES